MSRSLKGCQSSDFLLTLTRDFRLQVFFVNQCPPGPQVFHWSHFEFFRKFAEIFANYCLSPVSTTPVINCSAVSTTLAKNLLLVSLTPAINLCHDDKFIAGHKNKDTIEVGSCQGKEKVEGDKSAISPAADGVIGTAMKSCIQKHPTHLDQKPRRPPKLNNAVLV